MNSTALLSAAPAARTSSTAPSAANSTQSRRPTGTADLSSAKTGSTTGSRSSETTYWPQAGSTTEAIVLWFQENEDEFLHGADIALKWGVRLDSVAPMLARPMYYGLVKREKVDGMYRYSAGDKR